MKILNYISKISSIDTKYLILIIKTIILFLILTIIKKIGIKIIKRIKDSKTEYLYTQKYKQLINLSKIIIFIFIWGENLGKLLTKINLITTRFNL